MKKMKSIFCLYGLTVLAITVACSDKLAPVASNALTPKVVTEQTEFDTDDPAIWINPQDPSKSLIIGTDKELNGGLYVYDLKGKIVNKVTGLQRPNNVDVAYGVMLDGKKVDVAITTERKSKKLRIYTIPDLKPVDGGGIDIFVGEKGEDERDGMGVAIYTKKMDSGTNEIYAIVGRKTGPTGSYLWQYKLIDKSDGKIGAEVVRKFGTYSGAKEIEAIAVDNELGYIYYSDETIGVRKYFADPALNNNEELALFAKGEAKRDHEGIAIYKTGEKTGYILVSNQQNNSFLVYPREGENGNPNSYKLLADIPFSAVECDGADATSVNLGPEFPNGILVAMSNGQVFHIYDWNEVQKRILEGK